MSPSHLKTCRGVGDVWAGWAFTHPVLVAPKVTKYDCQSQISLHLMFAHPYFDSFLCHVMGVGDGWAGWTFAHSVFDAPKLMKISAAI